MSVIKSKEGQDRLDSAESRIETIEDKIKALETYLGIEYKKPNKKGKYEAV